MAASSDRAKKLIAQLKSSGNRPGAFSHVRPAELCEQLRVRIDYPELINQGSTPFCEPTSIVYGLAQSNVAEYVDFVCHLFRYGHARLKSWLVQPCKLILHSNCFRHLGIDAVDWIPTVSIRNSEDKLLPLGLPIPGLRKKIDFKGVTLRETLKEVKAAGYTHVGHNFDRTIESLRQANHWFRKKYIVQLGINHHLLKTAPSHLKKGGPHSDHRVVLKSPIHIENHLLGADYVKLSVFSWGDEMDIPPADVKAVYYEGKAQEKLTLDQFLANYAGFVAFKY